MTSASQFRPHLEGDAVVIELEPIRSSARATSCSGSRARCNRTRPRITRWVQFPVDTSQTRRQTRRVEPQNAKRNAAEVP